MKFVGGYGELFKFNYWKFNPVPTGTIDQKTAGKKAGGFEVSFVNGVNKALRIDFSQQAKQQPLNVDVYDLSGRFVTTLYSGLTHASQLTLPLNDARMQRGVYMIRMSLGSQVVQVKSISMN
jgi:hypothetical protein